MKNSVAVILVLFAVTATIAAHAAGDGQQISFRTPGANLDHVWISGDNQYDRPVTWDSSRAEVSCDAQRCEEVRAEQWWFKGKVTVEYRLRGENTTHACHFYVNEKQSGNWVYLLAPGSSNEAQPKCQAAQPAIVSTTGVNPNARTLPALNNRDIPHGLCDRRISPLEDKTVAAATANLIAVVTVTAIHGETGTLQIEQILKAPHDAALAPTLDVAGIAEDSLNRPCRGNAAQVGHRYIALLWSPVSRGSGYQLITDDDGLRIWSAATQQSLLEALANPQPASSWRGGPDGIQTQLTLLPDQPTDHGELNLLLIFRNTGTKPVGFKYRSWPRADQSRCAVAMIPASKRRVAARDVPIAKADIENHFQTDSNVRKFEWTTGPGESSTFALQRVTSAAKGWGFKEELGFKYYPAPPGGYSVSVECVKLLAGGAKLSTEPIRLDLR